MMFCCNDIEKNWQISDWADVANIIIAIVNLFFAIYIFIYQRNRDLKENDFQLKKEIDARLQAINLQEQNIKLQWFKELIIQPHIKEINLFYKKIYSIETKFNVNHISDDLKIEACETIKLSSASLRKSFIDILLSINPKLYSDIKENIDKLVDTITTKIIDAGLNLNDKPTFDKEIGKNISYSHNDLISKLYNYKGL